jgi:hypothetical protein
MPPAPERRRKHERHPARLCDQAGQRTCAGHLVRGSGQGVRQPVLRRREGPLVMGADHQCGNHSDRHDFSLQLRGVDRERDAETRAEPEGHQVRPHLARPRGPYRRRADAAGSLQPQSRDGRARLASRRDLPEPVRHHGAEARHRRDRWHEDHAGRYDRDGLGDAGPYARNALVYVHGAGQRSTGERGVLGRHGLQLREQHAQSGDPELPDVHQLAASHGGESGGYRRDRTPVEPLGVRRGGQEEPDARGARRRPASLRGWGRGSAAVFPFAV